MHWKRYVVVCGLLLLVAGCGEKKWRPVSQEQFGEDWPLTVPSGTLACVVPFWQDVHYIIFISPDGKQYDLSGKVEKSGNYLPIYSILKPAPQNQYYKFVSHRVLAKESFKLCLEEFCINE